MSGLRLSVIVPNYNYGDFVAEAVESALAVDWPDVEVIVVDDGSTDHSREVLASYSDRVRVVFQANSGPRVACNRGFELSTGDAVIFLDSDDVLHRDLMNEAARYLRTGVTKVQLQMWRIDSESRNLGSRFPEFRYVPSPEEVRRWAVTTTEYPTPPGSGNLYARDFLERVLPADGSAGDATDSYTLARAPLEGNVVTVAKPLVGYRLHGRNRSSLRADVTRFPRQVERARLRHRYAFHAVGLPASEHQLRRSRHLLQLRIAACRVAGRPGLPGDSRWRLLVDALRSPFAPGIDGGTKRAAIAVWSLVALISPRRVTRWLVDRRFR